MIDKICIEECQNSHVKCKDGTRYIVFKNDDRESYQKIRVDGCAVTEGPRADWVVERKNCAVVIELKGRDVERGAEQILSTANLWMNIEKRCDKISAILIAKQYPRANTSIQIKQQKFAKAFKGPLHVITHNAEILFENVFLFKNPLKKGS